MPIAVDAAELNMPENVTKPGDEAQNGASRRRGRRNGRKDRVDRNGADEAVVDMAATPETFADDALAPALPSVSSPASVSPMESGDLPGKAPEAPEAPTGNPQLEMPLTVFEALESVEHFSESFCENAPSDEASPVTAQTEAAQIPVASAAVPEEAPAPVPVADAIDAALANSGLVMIETRSDTSHAHEPSPEASPLPPRPRRQRVAPTSVPEEPLVMVETRPTDE